MNKHRKMTRSTILYIGLFTTTMQKKKKIYRPTRSLNVSFRCPRTICSE